MRGFGNSFQNKGFVIAHDGTLSDQIDIIIYDRVFSPLAFICEDVKYIPVESVHAVIEVKQELKGNCQYAGEKAASVRRLPRKVIPQVRVGGKLTDTNPPVEILAGIIATSYGWKTEPLGNTLEVNLRSVAENPLNRINFGCDLQDGAFWVEYEPEFRLEKSAKEETLLFLFLKLFLKLQSNGTIPPIDLMAYASVLDSFQNTEAAQGMTEQ